MSDTIMNAGVTRMSLDKVVDELVKVTTNLRHEVDTLWFMTVLHATDAVASEATFRRLGGTGGIQSAVRLLYERVMADSQLAPYFTGADMAHIRQRQAEMFLALFGVEDYEGVNLGAIHSHLEVTPEDFDRLMTHVRSVLEDAQVPATEVNALVQRLQGFKGEIATGGTDGA